MNGRKITTQARPERRQPLLCALSQIGVGTAVRIKQLEGCPEMSQRLREMGVCEEQDIKVLLKQSSLVCKVCNVRVGLSAKLADHILVEAVADPATSNF